MDFPLLTKLEIKKRSADNQQNQNTLILEITQEHFLSCVGPMLPLQLCVFGSWCETWAARVHVFSSLQKETFCTKLDLPFLKNETCLSGNRNPV